MNKYLPYALLFGFLFFGFSAYLTSKPDTYAPIFKEIKNYSPYYFEKSFGGLEIKSKLDKKFKLKPSNMEVFHKYDELQKEWGKKHLNIKNKTLFIYDDNKKEITTIPIKTKQDMDFLRNYYGK